MELGPFFKVTTTRGGQKREMDRGMEGFLETISIFKTASYVQ